MKTDARVRYTKMVLKESLLELLEEKPINKITVKEVCNLAGINRATFYSHYSDCFDLLEKIEDEIVAEFQLSLSYSEGLDVSKMVTAIYDIIDSNSKLCKILISGNNGSTLLGKMVALAHDSSIANWRKYLKKASETQLELLFACLSGGLMRVVLNGYGRYEKHEIIEFVNAMVASSVAIYI